MFKKFISIVPVAALTLTVSTTAQASTITVEKGDTLWDLARANNTTVENIQTVNDLTTDLIHPGDVLAIAKEIQYKVKQGDTLWDIAAKHQITVKQIKEWNHLHNDLIHPDLTLIIFEGVKGNQTVVTKNKEITTVQQQKKNTSKETVSTSNNASSKEDTSKVTTPSNDNNASKEQKVAVSSPATSTEASREIPSEETATSTKKPGLKEINVEATAYTASCDGCSGITSTGINLKENPDAKVISVDPTVIPLGSKVYVEGYGEAIAGDTGGGIKGNKIDVFISSQQEAVNFGVKQLKVTILD